MLAGDLDYICERLQSILPLMKDARVFITGGTGFFGKWLLLSFMALIKQGHCIEVVVLSRDPEKFLSSFPEFYGFEEHISFLKGDVRDFPYPVGRFTHVIHAATAASASLNEQAPLEMLTTILDGTTHVLDFCVSLAHQPQILFISSGAVYGVQPSELTHISEVFKGSPDVYHAASAYGVGKYTAEHLCYQYQRTYGISIKIARCFSFVGPYLSLDAHFAIGNFIRDGLRGEAIVISGDGSPFRSYQYAADLIVWLFYVLLSGRPCYPYNVGSDEDYDIEAVAHCVAAQFSNKPRVVVAKKRDQGCKPARYVPSVQRAVNELGVPANFSLNEALARTIAWYQSKN